MLHFAYFLEDSNPSQVRSGQRVRKTDTTSEGSAMNFEALPTTELEIVGMKLRALIEVIRICNLNISDFFISVT